MKMFSPVATLMKTAALLFLTLLTAVQVRAQSAKDGFDPNANGIIRVVVVQPDGKVLIGGDFTTLSPNGGAAVTRNHIARLNPDGTLDDVFDPNANDSVWSIAVQADGNILAGGDFTSIGGEIQNYLARLDATTGANGLFNPGMNGPVRTITVQTDGKILLGGLFTQIGAIPRSRIARVNPNGSNDSGFNTGDQYGANSDVYAIAVQADGKILVGGAFNGANSIGGQTRNGIARLNATTGAADAFDPNANSYVLSIAVQADRKILVGGDFTTLAPNGGATVTRNRIARLDAATGLADSFNPNASGRVYAIAVQADGEILAGGSFANIGGGARSGIARLDATAGFADSFDPNANSLVYAIAVQADGKILAGGVFTSIGGQARNRIARLYSDGSVDDMLDAEADGPVYALAVQADGKILIGGDFTHITPRGMNGVPRDRIARLNAGGTLDTTFPPDGVAGANGAVYALAVQADGKILVGGTFTTLAGDNRSKIGRLNPTGSLNSNFNFNDQNGANGTVYALAVQANGNILVGGDFNGANSIGGQPRNRIARLDRATGAADAFNPDADMTVRALAVEFDNAILAGGAFTTLMGMNRSKIGELDENGNVTNLFAGGANMAVYTLAEQANNKTLVGGAFTTLSGGVCNKIGRLDIVGDLDPAFTPNANGPVYTLAVQTDGKILVGGSFSSLGGDNNLKRMGRVMAANGAIDGAFVPGADCPNNNCPDGSPPVVYALAVQGDGKILAGGNFTRLGGRVGPNFVMENRSYIGRLTNNGIAVQQLTVNSDGTTITWLRSGVCQEVNRVTFEKSNDGVNYTALPTPTRTSPGSSWQLTGVTGQVLPARQNIFLRARGFYSTGIGNGSGSIVETGRNVWVFQRPPATVDIESEKQHGGAGRFGVPLPRGGNALVPGSVGIECRNPPYQIVFSFATSVTFSSAAVTSGTGTVSSVTTSGNDVMVNLAGVTNAQIITVTLYDVDDGMGDIGDIDVPMGVLIGDTTGSGTVNAGDVSQTKSRVGQLVDQSDFRSDVSANGAINAGDVATIKSKVGTGLP